MRVDVLNFLDRSLESDCLRQVVRDPGAMMSQQQAARYQHHGNRKKHRCELTSSLHGSALRPPRVSDARVDLQSDAEGAATDSTSSKPSSFHPVIPPIIFFTERPS